MRNQPTGLLINIDVPEIEPAIRFYQDALGLTLGRRLGEDFVELLGLAAPFYLLKAAPESLPFKNAPAARTYARHWTPVHLDIVVKDIEESIHQAQNAGARLEVETQTKKYGKLAVLSDPWGNGFCFIQFTGRGYDEIVLK